MFLLKNIIVALLVYFANISVFARQELLKVALYYEALCPFSREFVTDQLFPGYWRIKDSLILDLVPYGKANHTKINGKWVFHCQHGRRECIANKLQACIMGQNLSQDCKMGFVDCIMKSSDPSSAVNSRNCSGLNNISWNEINSCFTGVRGDELLAYYGDRTEALNPKLRYVPYILFNGVYNDTIEDDARRDFFKTACALFHTSPAGCRKTNYS